MSSPLRNINKGDPVVAQRVRDKYTAPEEDRELVTIEQWRRYDRRLFGEMIAPDGSTNGKTEQVPGLLIKLVPSEGWVIMDDGIYYRLGLRAYAGT